MRTFEQSSGQSLTRPPGAFTLAVIIPVARAAITACGLGTVASMGAWALDYGGDSLGIGAMVAAVGFLAAWLLGTRGPGHVAIGDHGSEAPPGGPSRLVMINPKASADPDRAARFSEFTNAAERDSSTRRLRGLGYSDGEICEFRDTLIRLGWAAWNASDKRGGWRLTSPAEDVLEAMA